MLTAAALATAALVGLVVGGTNGDAALLSASTDGRPTCTEPTAEDEVAIEDLLVVPVPGERGTLSRTIEVDLPSSYWEVDALRDPTTSESVRFRAALCLDLTDYFANELSYESGDGRTTVTSRSGGEVGAVHRECGPAWDIDMGADGYRISSSDCPDISAHPDVTVTGAVRAEDRSIGLSSAPDQQRRGRASWTWTGTDAPDVVVVVPLSIGERLTAWTTNARVAIPSPLVTGDLAIHVPSVTPWLPVAIALLALAYAASRTAPANRRPIHHLVAFVAVISTPALIVPAGPSQTVRIALVGIGMALAALAFAEDEGTRVVAAVVAGVLALALPTVGVLEGATSQALVAGILVVDVLVAFALVGGALASALATAAALASPGRRQRVAAAIRLGVGVALAFGVGFAFGVVVQSGPEADESGVFIARTLIRLVATLVPPAAAVLAARQALRSWSDDHPTPAATAVLLVSWAVLARPPDLDVWGIVVPVAAVVLVAAADLVIGYRAPTPRLLGRVAEVELAEPDVSRRLLAHGPRADWRANVHTAVEIGCVIATVPVALFALAVLRDLPTLVGGGGALIVAEASVEVGLWLGGATLFALLYRRLPGRYGFIKAMVLGGAWLGAAAAVELGRLWLDDGTGREWLFPGLKLLLFLMVLGVVYDALTLEAAGGSWTMLQAICGIERGRDYARIVVPVALVVVALAQQISTGSGLDLVGVLLEGVPAPGGSP